MGFEKKILILKQALEGFSISDKAVSGIVRLEEENGVCSLHLSLINLSSLDSGNYFLALLPKNERLTLIDLGVRPITFNKTLDAIYNVKGISVALTFIKDDIPVVIAFASDNNLPLPKFKKLLAEKCLEMRDSRQKSVQNDDISIRHEQSARYDDEAITTDNYYKNDLSFEEKLKYIEKVNNEYLRNENASRLANGKEKAQDSQKFSFGLQDEELACACPPNSAEHPFIFAAREKLNFLFSSHEEMIELSKIIPESKWVKIDYSENKYYVVGLVKEHGKEKYICYGVPSKYSLYPPSELAPYCSFIPLSVFDLQGDGFWMMFQSAESGECIKLNNKK